MTVTIRRTDFFGQGADGRRPDDRPQPQGRRLVYAQERRLCRRAQGRPPQADVEAEAAPKERRRHWKRRRRPARPRASSGCRGAAPAISVALVARRLCQPAPAATSGQHSRARDRPTRCRATGRPSNRVREPRKVRRPASTRDDRIAVVVRNSRDEVRPTPCAARWDETGQGRRRGRRRACTGGEPPSTDAGSALLWPISTRARAARLISASIRWGRSSAPRAVGAGRGTDAGERGRRSRSRQCTRDGMSVAALPSSAMPGRA